MNDEVEDYSFYKYCRICGDMIDEDIYDDNDGICDYCYINKRTWSEISFGEYNEN
jgi:hypothetical protein